MVKRLLAALLLAPLATIASAQEMKLDHANVDIHDAISIQRGARVFVNYCLSCHSASYMRYNRLTELGLTEAQIKDNLMFASEKVGDLMTVSMRAQDAKSWFGVAPPDLSVIARARGADWLYSYLRAFYRDDSRPTGWNNLVFPNVGMPHVLWELQGMQRLETTEVEHEGQKIERRNLVLDKPGAMTPAEYDQMVRDLVDYLVFMGEPVQTFRVQIGVVVLFFLALLFVLTWAMKREFWKDVH